MNNGLRTLAVILAIVALGWAPRLVSSTAPKSYQRCMLDEMRNEPPSLYPQAQSICDKYQVAPDVVDLGPAK
jgi:hypothetical protein